MSESSLGLFGIHGQALVYRQERLNLIAGNLANADTPHFRAQDIDFQSALRAAVSKDAAGERRVAAGRRGRYGPVVAAAL